MSTQISDQRRTPQRMAGGGLRGAVAAERIKLFSLRSTWYFLLTAAGVMGATAACVGAVTHDAKASAADPATLATVYGVEFVVAGLAMLCVTGEYATGSITNTLQCVPDRARLLTAKSLTVGVVAFGAGIVLAALGVVAGVAAMDESTFDFAHVAGRVFAVAVHLMLMSVLTIGLAAIVRSSAGTITVLFVLLLIVPTILQSIPLDFLTNLAQFLPQAAGTQFLTGDADLYGPATGLLLLAAWTAASLTLATVILRRRDA
ncbi:ABC transporter permease subunit [Streptomyces sp. NPDC058257]|uniref:ABC transporter permease subunit n=1 Tax=Streptomyces sp. NPDC058257 TaxID=3346409 RepID=UPI0036E0E505